MASIRWSAEAAKDFANIRDYLSEYAPENMSAVLQRIIDRISQLEQHPFSGRKVPEAELPSHLREVLSDKYRIIYEPIDDIIYIKTIIHGARDFRPG